MKTTLAATLLAIAFLSAGAFANNKSADQVVTDLTANQTIISKNSEWPIREMMTVEPCSYVRCENI